MREARTSAIAHKFFKVIVFISFVNELMNNEDICLEKIALCIWNITFSEIQGHDADNSDIHL